MFSSAQIITLWLFEFHICIVDSAKMIAERLDEKLFLRFFGIFAHFSHVNPPEKSRKSHKLGHIAAENAEIVIIV